MRTLMLAAMALTAVAVMPGCKKKQAVQYVEEGGSQLSSAVNVADPKAAIQLLRGFHDVENNAWRWTGPKFAVALRPPKEIPAGGAKLFVEYALPEVFLQKVPETTLTILVNGKALDPEKLNKPGSGRIERTVPVDLLKGDVVTVDFALDKYLEAGAVDQRDLGLIVSVVGLEGAKPPAPATNTK